ncbi:MarR family winged helix-turn-helix transcriptional regulator [Pediococcus argentinicus]|nr:MarR family transcriptional regulator [Pediococcus argentinicus]NKZ23167.1 MarR family transcriptional regulator [Pediococcus argentinicus]GEP20347.1 MarR family transcriptional regulator [Pediococcus argentinicus]
MINLLRQLGLISRISLNEANTKFKEIGLNNNQFQYLMRICEQPGLFLDELANEMKVDRTTNFRAVNNLIKRGYVEKRADSSNRKVRRLFPTDLGIKVYPELHECESNIAERAMSDLSDGERLVLQELLVKITKKIELK